ncbi:MAG: prepilin peptidase [Patescibacteria group bacterium]
MEKFFLDAAVFVFGASIGSFINVLADRLPHNETIMGRSRCDSCGKKIDWYDLIPVISYFTLDGKCRHCHKELSFQYPLVETLTGMVFLFIFSRPDAYVGMEFLRSLIVAGVASSLIVIFISDLKYHLISDYMLISFFIFSLAYVLFGSPDILNVLKEAAVSSLMVSIPIFLIYYVSRERAMGLGDVYLTATIGFLLGWKAGYIALYIAFVTGAIVGVYLLLKSKKKMKSRIPFGPFLVIGTMAMSLYGQQAIDFISKIYGL